MTRFIPDLERFGSPPSSGSACLMVLLLLAGCAHAPAEPPDTGAAVAPPPPPAAPTLRALTLSLGTQRFVYTEDGALVRAGPISSGASGRGTPRGSFSVLSKHADKVSSRYANTLGMPAWMPYAMQFHGNYFLHEGWLPGYPASHGCVRLGAADARFLFERMRIGDAVTVVD